MKKMTLRIPPELHEKAEGYAQGIGLSLNGLMLVALADYLRIRDDANMGVIGYDPEPPPNFEDDIGVSESQNVARTRKSRPRHKKGG